MNEDERERMVAQALATITEARLRKAAVEVTSIPSPTGGEAPLAGRLAERLAAAGVESHLQRIDDGQANAVGRLRGDGTGADLMLYAPIDTLTTGDPDQDVPWIGPGLRPDMRAEAQCDGPYVSGLGASNPKGHAACVLVVGEALASVGARLAGDLLVAFGAGGMPTNAIDGTGRLNTGQGAGCSFLLERGWHPDYAVIAKPGDFVAHEEVGLCWFEIVVPGIHTYAGSRHRLPYQNPIVTAAKVVTRLEGWLAAYPERHRTATAAPQGIIGSIAGGWERMPAVTPAACRIRLDLRIAPGTTPLAAKRELAEYVRGLSAELGVELTVEMVLAIPGTRTPPEDWVVRSAVRAWESVAVRPHEPIDGNSGATDANILRARGIPTARVGMPKVVSTEFDVDFARGMNTVDVRAMRRLCELLVRVAVDTTTRTRAEIAEIGD
ncbi:M20 family metallopeptidase [Nonomuraea aurantiaca]|uniref:M20 family metallopeptidase n=1 Tax=Nonomuraea aurantiaca TaxID=2878562 RepID=UPI001CDA48AC|nr:peptidase dimerization domain-containing protein [Nonomuraea aurantiaca]MCA2221919.1 peptidase dimerization domain-containing protein [Nonomuraea aurantiaca]